MSDLIAGFSGIALGYFMRWFFVEVLTDEGEPSK